MIRLWYLNVLFWSILGLCALGLGLTVAYSKDSGQWQYAEPSVKEYFASLFMPDYPTTSCCGEGDAYYADDVDTDDQGQIVAIITDTRPDEPLHRMHIPTGTRIVVPPVKIRKRYQPNPTGHTIIFTNGSAVYCYEPVGGI